ncbi:S-adenosylmethionine:tRNA ribosyltransferase-isomerase [mine drainage metagenome]|uniref:S-adenosylmethionine:tRNA ribosyltransferase-isomerase n=1 Tax=mine drainage metagenome TaxID=410659 RepID=A0A1J5SMT7_9ZZZZ
MRPEDLLIKDFTYELAEEKIAKYPLQKRDESKLLVYDGNISEDFYCNLHKHLPENSLLIFNNTKVVEARILFQKISGGTIEIFCLEPDERYADITSAMLQKEKVLWKCLVGGAKKWKHGSLVKKINYNSIEIILSATIVEKRNDYFLIEFNWNDDSISFAEVLHHAGLIPLPPYLNRDAEENDNETYQTIYAKHDGSVAAPTAGLHFTESLFEKLSTKNIQKYFVTLHVGAGTFKPVKTETIAEHEMHAEFFDVSISFIENLIANIDRTIVAVGTTSARTIESLYWMGVKIVRSRESGAGSRNLNPEDISVHQWDPYNSVTASISAKDSLQILIHWMRENNLERLITKTQIIIAPGYEFRIIEGLITNFHQPQSTLLLLVAALVGDDWKKIYQYALNNNFRFLSYGDGSLLWKKK